MANETTSTIPASWFREQAMYDFEKRAIVSKHWILITHKNRFTKAGDYLTFSMAGIPFIVIRDRSGDINSFLNVCRHRAFPLLQKEEGTASILSCKYHGWSYGLKGQLAKAPRFQEVEDFDKSKHNLYSVHTHIDRIGLVWVNLDASPEPIPFEEQFGGLDTRPDMQKYNLSNYVFEETWTMPGKFNWKTLVENYNECYHCATAHPGVATLLTKETKFEINPVKSYIRHLGGGVGDTGVVTDDELDAEPTYLFPFSTFNPTKPLAYIMLIEPTSPNTCNLRYDFFRNPAEPMDKYVETRDFFKQVEREDKWLGDNDQPNLDSSTYAAGPLHPYMEKAVAHFEKLLRSALKEHADLEGKAGRQISPAQRTYQTAQLQEDEAFCQSLCEASPATKLEMTW